MDKKDQKQTKPPKESKPTKPSTEEIKPKHVSEIQNLFKPNENSEIDYSQILKKFSLSPLTLETDFIKNNSLPSLQTLTKREITFCSKNLSQLNTSKFFIWYELIPTELTCINLPELFTWQIIKELITTFKCHLIIEIADDYTFSDNKITIAQIKKYTQEKLTNVLCFLNLPEESKNLIHIFSNRELRWIDNSYENMVTQFKMSVPYQRIQQWFDVTDDDPISKVDYPCYLACAVNPVLHSKYISDITPEYNCLVINQVNYSGRYELCYDAAKEMKFNAPSEIFFKIVPQLTGISISDCFESDNEHTLISEDDDKSLRKKIMKHSLSGSRGNGSWEDHKAWGGNVSVDVSCKYLEFFELDDNKWNDNVMKFSKGEITCGEIKQVMFEVINALFKSGNESKTKLLKEYESIIKLNNILNK